MKRHMPLHTCTTPMEGTKPCDAPLGQRLSLSCSLGAAEQPGLHDVLPQPTDNTSWTLSMYCVDMSSAVKKKSYTTPPAALAYAPEN